MSPDSGSTCSRVSMCQELDIPKMTQIDERMCLVDTSRQLQVFWKFGPVDLTVMQRPVHCRCRVSVQAEIVAIECTGA